jgi:outer membrane protein assembly factor BamB
MSTVDPQGIARTNNSGPQQGTLYWAKNIWEKGKSTQGGPAIGPDGTIYIGCRRGFFALSPEGDIKWSLTSPPFDRLYTGPVVARDSTIYVGGLDFYALKPDGTVKWIFQGGSGFVEIRPLIGIDGTIFTKDANGNIYAIAPDGNLIWHNSDGQAGGISYMSASPDGSTIYAPGKDSTLMALNAANGTLLWLAKTRLYLFVGPTVDCQGNIYFPGADEKGDRYIYSYTCSDSLRWKYKVDYAFDSPYAGINIDKNGYLYFDWGHRGIISLDYAGHLRWKLESVEVMTDAPIICDVNSNLYILNFNKPEVWCYYSDGSLKFSLEVPGYSSSQLFPAAINNNGIMYFGASSPWMVALQ